MVDFEILAERFWGRHDILPYQDIIVFAPSESTVAPGCTPSGKPCRKNRLHRLKPDCGAIAHPFINTLFRCVQRNIYFAPSLVMI